MITFGSELDTVKSITVVNKRSLWGYKGDFNSPFLKLTISELKGYPKIRGAFERGDVHFREYFQGECLLTFESNINYELRFMIDYNIVGMNWLTLPAGAYTLRQNPISNCQIEVDIE